MTATYLETEIDRYVAEVAGHLGAVPDGERAELLDDLREHLAEVAAEGDGPLAVRVGPPADYAAELLASAGLAPVDVGVGPIEQARAAWRSVQASAPYRSVVDFLPELRPAWWVLRAIAVVFAANVFLVHGWERTWPWPDGGPIARGLVLLPLCLAVAASVAVGRRSAAGRRSRLVWLGNLAVLPLALAAMTAMHTEVASYSTPTTYVQTGQFVDSNGNVVTNIYPYDAEGQLLHGVLLYDQEGVPIDLRDQASGQGIQTQVVPDLNGAPIGNAYPYDQRTPNDAEPGTTPAGQPPAIVVPRRSTTATTEAAPVTTPTTTAPPVSGAG